MALFSTIMGGLNLLASPVTEVIKGWQSRKQKKLESDLLISEAKTQAIIHKLETKQTADIAWENTQIGNSGWKDEYWTLVLSIPAIFCFIPGLSDYALQGFKVLDHCPAWYRWMLGIAVGAAFGYKKIADFMSLQKGA